MIKTPGWWNDDGDFTFEEFLGLWISHEGSGTDPYLISVAVNQNLFVGGWNNAYCDLQACKNGGFNFIAAYGQPSGGFFVGTENLDKYVGPEGMKAGSIPQAGALGDHALDPHSVELWDQDDGPSNWRNATLWTIALRKNDITEGWINGTDRNTVYYYKQSFIVFSVNQIQYWETKNVDTSMDP